MSGRHGWRRIIRLAFTKRHAEQQVDDELRFHFESLVERLVAQGRAEEDARREVMERFESYQKTRTAMKRKAERKVVTPGWRLFLDGLGQDLRISLRTCVTRPGFTAIAVLTIALGIGASTSMFSVVNGVLLNPLPHEDADRLVILWETDSRRSPPLTRVNVTGGNFADWRRMAQSFEGIGAYSIGRATLTGLGDPEMITRAWVTSGFLGLLRARPSVGRVFLPREDSPDAASLAVLSHEFWQQRYGGSPDVLGATLTLNRDSYEIVGVLDPSVDFLARGVEVWTPFRIDEADFDDRHSHFLNVLARLKPQVSHQEAEAEMRMIADRIGAEYPEWMTGRSVNVLPLLDELVGNARPTLLLLLGAVLVMLIIATVNVASLLIVRAIARRREIAVRCALGASSGRLVRLFLTESTMLSLTGGILGVVLAFVGTNLLLSLAPAAMPRLAEVGVDLRVLTFSLGVSLSCGLAIGLLPSLQMGRLRPAAALSSAGRWSSGSERRRLRHALVVAELALSMTLLVGAGLITQTFWRLVSVDPGFRSENTLTAGIRLPQAEYPDVTTVTAFHDALLEKVRALPQVSSAALTRFLPLSDGPWTFAFDCEELPLVPDGERLAYAYVPVSTEYFRTAGISLLRGRSFTDADNADASKVLVINEAMKQQFWPDEDPLGVRIRFDVDTSADPWREIVGIVNDVHHDGLHLDARPAFYGPRQQGFNFLLDRMRLVVRTNSEPLQVAQSVRDIVRGIDPNLAVFDIRTMSQLLTRSVAQPWFSMWLFLCFAFVAAFLALIGIYGVISHTVRHRLPELGLRVALGAQGRNVGLLVLTQGMVLAAQGIGLGLLLALISTRMVKGLLFGISASDPLTYIMLTLILATASAAACYVPARKAAKADPMVVMRGEA